MTDPENYTDRRLLQEYLYLKPMGPSESDAENVKQMDDGTLNALVAVCDELADRVDERPPTQHEDVRAF